jgi:hypothetical protein
MESKRTTDGGSPSLLRTLFRAHDELRAALDLAIEQNDCNRRDELFKILRSVSELIDSFRQPL